MSETRKEQHDRNARLRNDTAALTFGLGVVSGMLATIVIFAVGGAW